jgi:hypothetical protein
MSLLLLLPLLLLLLLLRLFECVLVWLHLTTTLKVHNIE